MEAGKSKIKAPTTHEGLLAVSSIGGKQKGKEGKRGLNLP
jgi:hypothetical protein